MRFLSCWAVLTKRYNIHTVPCGIFLCWWGFGPNPMPSWTFLPYRLFSTDSMPTRFLLCANSNNQRYLPSRELLSFGLFCSVSVQDSCALPFGLLG